MAHIQFQTVSRLFRDFNEDMFVNLESKMNS